MKLSRSFTLQEIAQKIDCQFIGDPGHSITGINEIHQVVFGDLVFVDHPKYYEKALHSNATTILINKEDVEVPEGKALIISNDPFRDFNTLTKHFKPFVNYSGDRGDHFECGTNSIIQANVSIGNNVKIGDNCIIHSGVTIYDHTLIGNNVEIHSGTVIGGDAFYYQKREGKFEKMHSCGHVEIHDHAEIGSSCTIDRGVSGPTIIGEGTKLDNLIQIGHDTVIGKNCLFAAQVGIAGCVTIEDDVTIWGQVGVKSDIRIAKNVVVYAQSGVGMDLEEGKSYFGSPCVEAREKMRELALIKKLPDLFDKDN